MTYDITINKTSAEKPYIRDLLIYKHYLMYERQLAVSTVNAYLYWMSKFCDFIIKDLKSVSRDDVREFMRHLTDYKRKPQTIANYVAGLRSYYGYLSASEKNEELIPLCFFLDKLRIKKERSVRQVPSFDEVEKLRTTMQAYKSALSNRQHTGTYRILLRDIAVIEAMLTLGGRSKELRTLKVADFDFVNHTVLIKGKGGHQRVSIFSHTAQIAITEHIYYNSIGDSALVFPMGQGNLLRYIIKRWAKRAKINTRLHPHSFRHYHITESQRRGVNIQAVADQCGHVSLNTTRKYTHLDVNFRRDEYKNREI